jgi:uncharacterized peroxidase-related enzyme
MSRIDTPAADSATGEVGEIFARVKKAAGAVPNAYAAIGALSPAALKAIVTADGLLATGTLDRKDRETISVVVSHLTGCDYCLAAHSLMGKMAGLQPDTLRRLRNDEPTGEAKRDALVRLVRTLIQTRGTISAAEFEAIKAAGYTDAQLVETSLAVSVTIFTNAFNRINDTTLDFPAVA